MSRKWRGSLLDVSNRHGADIDIDHELITEYIKMKLICRKKDNELHRHNRLNVQLLRNPATKKALTRTIHEKLLKKKKKNVWEVTNVKLSQIAEVKIGIVQTS